MLLLLSISSAFAHTRCISPSVCLLKSFMQASTSLLRGRRGHSRAAHRNQQLRLFALALADGSGLPFSLYPPQAALESQTPQREARALPRHALKSTASERKIVTKETHQGCLSFLFKSPLPCKGEARALPCRRTDSTVPAEFANSHYRYKNVTARRSHLNISPKGRNISHARSAYFTAPKARFHTAAKLPYFTASQAVLATQKSGAHRSTAFLQN